MVADAKGFHAGIVVHGGMTAMEVKIVQASTTRGQIEEVNLTTYAIDRTAPWGFARDAMFEDDINPYFDQKTSQEWNFLWDKYYQEGLKRLEGKSSSYLLDRFVFHGHP